MKKRLLSILFIAAILIIGYINRTQLLDWIKTGGFFSVMISMLVVAMGAFFPIIPFPISGGVIGAVFGVWQGALISLAGAMLGTTVFFLLVRYGFRNLARSYVLKYEIVKKYEMMMLNKPFLAVCLSRMITFIPAAAVNIIWGLSDVGLFTFFFASSLGKIPNIVLVNFAGSIFTQHSWIAIIIYATYNIIIGASHYFLIFKNEMNEIKKSKTIR